MSVAEARIRVGFIDCSDRAVLRMCAGCASSDGYSPESEFGTRSVELKCGGCADHSESANYAVGSGVRSEETNQWESAVSAERCPQRNAMKDFGMENISSPNP